MPDLSAAYDIPNPFALFASDFAYDLAGYRAALGFLSDLAGGSDHNKALKDNGGDPASLRAWQASDKFRRVYAKCRAAGEAEQKWTAEHAEQAQAPDPTPNPFPTTVPVFGVDPIEGQRFIPFEEVPIVSTVFVHGTNAASWGGE